MPFDFALWLTLISSNYLCLEHIFMVPKVFDPLKFSCISYRWYCEKRCYIEFENKEGLDQPAYLYSLIGDFPVCIIVYEV